MNYFQEYEKLKKYGSLIRVGSRWEIIESTRNELLGGFNLVGNIVEVEEVDMNTQLVEYSYPIVSTLRSKFYRPIEVFKRTFSRII